MRKMGILSMQQNRAKKSNLHKRRSRRYTCIHYDPSLLAELEQITQGQTLAIEGAEHLLEVADGIIPSLQVMEQVIQSIRTFLDTKC